jgi:hypothetical protein
MKTSNIIIIAATIISIFIGFYSGAFINEKYYDMKISNAARELKFTADSLVTFKQMFLKCNGQLIEISNDPVWQMYIDNTTPETTN